MKNIVIKENIELPVDDETAASVISMLTVEPDLPLSIKDNVLSFAEYTVGSLKVGDLNIEIQSRNPAFSTSALFEMMLFESLNNFDETNTSSGFGEDYGFGFSAITSQFYLECSKLVEFGLTGGFVTNEKVGKQITGPIVMEKFHPMNIPLNGVAFLNNEYSFDVPANQIIKAALIKVSNSEQRTSIRNKYQQLLKGFGSVKEYGGNLYIIDDVAAAFYSANPHYPVVLEYAIKILKDMKMKFTHGNMEWYAFLHNSNDIFEKYVRKIVTRGLNAYITKWDTPQKIAVLDDGVRKGIKSYVPDILVDYNPNSNTAKAVLDVKNKTFDIKGNDISEILHSADMYQLTFYCDKLKTNLGGLIYPASRQYKPINVMIDGNQDFRFVLFSINMKEKIRQRHRNLCNDIKDYLLYYSK